MLESMGSYYEKFEIIMLITFDWCLQYEMLEMALHGIAHEEKVINNQYIEPFYMQESNPIEPAPSQNGVVRMMCK